MDDRTGSTGLSPAQRRAATEAIGASRAATVRLVASLTRLWEDIVEASALTAVDDEHDPEGATVAFERERVKDMLARARRDLDDLDRAARRLRTGEYGVCERCGGPISAGRLAARPVARTCITCAGQGAG